MCLINWGLYSDRFRLPIVPLLCAFSGFAVVNTWRLVRTPDARLLARYGFVLALAACIVNSRLYPITTESPARDEMSLGLVAMNDAKFDVAIEHFIRSSANTSLPNLHLNWGVAEWMLGNKAAALDEFRKELSYFPHSYGAMANLGYYFLSVRQLDSAQVYASRAVERKPYMPAGYIVAAQAFQFGGRISDAESVLVMGLIACGDDFLYGEYLLANAHWNTGKRDRAEREFRSILTRLHHSQQTRYAPESGFSDESVMGESRNVLEAKTLYALGHVYVARLNIDSAASLFRAAVERAPELADAWSDLGVALMQRGRYSESETALRRAVDLDSTNYAFWYNYGTLLGTIERFEEAKHAFERSLALRPDFNPARNSLRLTIERMRR
jgi:tetratricopeptide (TPR) repeat protein